MCCNPAAGSKLVYANWTSVNNDKCGLIPGALGIYADIFCTLEVQNVNGKINCPLIRGYFTWTYLFLQKEETPWLCSMLRH